MREDTPPLLRGPSDAAAEIHRLDQRIDGLKELIAAHDRRYEQRFLDSATAVASALNAAKEAVIKAEIASEKRFEGVNEFRASLADQQRTLMPRSESEFKWSSMDARVQTLEKKAAEVGGQKAGVAAVWGFAVGGIGLIVALASLLQRIFARP